MSKTIYLASRSPRRRELLNQLLNMGDVTASAAGWHGIDEMIGQHGQPDLVLSATDHVRQSGRQVLHELQL